MASRLLHLSRRFRRDGGGVALVEFAFVLPVMLLLYVGGVAVTQGLMTDRKVIILSRTIGDIIAQGTNVTAQDRTNVFNAARAVMTPYDSSAAVLRMRVSSVRINNKGRACIEWSIAPSGSTFSRTPGDEVDSVVPAALKTADTWLIMPEVEYDYKPIIGEDITGQIMLQDRLFLRPRQSAQVTLDSAPNASNNCPDTP